MTKEHLRACADCLGTAPEKIAGEIANMPIELIGVDTDLALARQAAAFKAKNKPSDADAFAAALAKLNNADLVTGDPEFKALQGQIAWLGSDPQRA